MNQFPYVWTWKSRLPERRGQLFRVIVRSKAMNSCMAEFEDGTRYITSRNALRKAKP